MEGSLARKERPTKHPHPHHRTQRIWAKRRRRIHPPLSILPLPILPSILPILPVSSSVSRLLLRQRLARQYRVNAPRRGMRRVRAAVRRWAAREAVLRAHTPRVRGSGAAVPVPALPAAAAAPTETSAVEVGAAAEAPGVGRGGAEGREGRGGVRGEGGGEGGLEEGLRGGGLRLVRGGLLRFGDVRAAVFAVVDAFAGPRGVGGERVDDLRPSVSFNCFE